MFKIMKYLKNYRFKVFLTVIFILGQGITQLALPTIMSGMVDEGMMEGDISYIINNGIWMIVISVICLFFSIMGAYYAARVSMGFGRDLRNLVFEKSIKLSIQQFSGFGTASLITRTTNDITQVQTSMILLLRMGIFTPVMCIGGIVMALGKDVKLSLILVVIVPLMFLFIFGIQKKVIPLFRTMQTKVDLLNMVMRENLTGIRVIKAFNKEETERRRFDDANLDLRDIAVKANRIMALVMPVMYIMMNAATIAITWFGGHRMSDGAMGIGDVMAFIQYAMHIMISFMFIGMIFVMLPRASVSADRIRAVIESESDGIEDDPDSYVPAETVKNNFYSDNVPAVEFRNVTYRYAGSETAALENVSFKAGMGETTAIIGSTGSGKSTMIQMIPRFFRPSEGQILVGGVDINDMKGSELRMLAGYVPQTPVLFSGTIADNIRYGNPDASDEEVIHAAEIAQARDFIELMPDKFDSEISQGGKNLSGGQKQRLAIARSIARKPQIYIFDDSFSALDLKTDAALRKALEGETAGSAVIIVAQRVSTVMNADCIVVMEEGRVVGTGRHDELMNSCEVYREIVLSQLSEKELA